MPMVIFHEATATIRLPRKIVYFSQRILCPTRYNIRIELLKRFKATNKYNYPYVRISSHPSLKELLTNINGHNSIIIDWLKRVKRKSNIIFKTLTVCMDG